MITEAIVAAFFTFAPETASIGLQTTQNSYEVFTEISTMFFDPTTPANREQIANMVMIDALHSGKGEREASRLGVQAAANPDMYTDLFYQTREEMLRESIFSE